MPRLTKELIPSLPSGTTLYHCSIDNADKTPVRARINGKMQERKRTGVWKLPMKHGFRDCFYIDPVNVDEWFTIEDEARLFRRGYLIQAFPSGNGWEVVNVTTGIDEAGDFPTAQEALEWAKRTLMKEAA